MKFKSTSILNILVFTLFFISNSVFSKKNPIVSITTKYTVLKVETAVFKNKTYIITSSYDGVVSAINFKGDVIWEQSLSGLMNHDLWVDDITGDGNQEVIAANADGSVFCINYKGDLLWRFKKNDSPMISACVVHPKKGVEPYVACGGNDLNIYYVSNKGELLTEIPSSSYPTLYRPNKKWQDDGSLPYDVHTVNFLRPLPQPDGTDVLLLDAILSHADKLNMYYYFKPEASKPFKSKKIFHGPVGDITVFENPLSKELEILLGTSGIVEKYDLGILKPSNNSIKKINFSVNTRRKLGFGYRVTQTEVIQSNTTFEYVTLKGEFMFITKPSADFKEIEVLESTFSYNDMHHDELNKKLILASAQSGGNQIHIVDYTHKKWKKAYEKLMPKGNIASILRETDVVKKNLKNYSRPKEEREPLKVTLMSPPSRHNFTVEMQRIKDSYKNLSFMGYAFLKDVGTWDRSNIEIASFRDVRDGRKKYESNAGQVVKNIISKYNENGLCTWGGHGVDPYYYGKETIKKVIDAGNGKPTVWVWPELTILHKKDFKYALDDLIYPLSDYSKSHNAKQFIRSKHIFWQSIVYKSEWSRFLSGEFADVLIPSMEETQDFAMELSLASRLGLWTSGVANDWGTRCARDNPSFMRSRQFSHQNLPNHFLRNAIFHVSYGAAYINNFNVDSEYSEYITVLWELIGKGVLYVPKRNEILSFSPVHLSITNPDETYLRDGNSSSTTLKYSKEKDNYVFSRLSSDWTGGQVTSWDFSSYAAGVKDRRLNFLAPYSNGMVLITPVQNGVYKQENTERNSLVDNLHPIYKNILTEYITNGKDYLSADGTKIMSASEYYHTIDEDIKKRASLLPITVTGEVAWVVAQTSGKHLRLTLIDNGYLNPKERVAKVQFHTIKPIQIKDILSEEKFKFNAKEESSIEITIPAGMFRFIDVELEEVL
ncbi:PQQ-binding-like beta-propeller repeat protein [Flavicella marina]|uniref:PQQ-binding-like beta-propeller repeat protein n=1 Tax=Flavicella marina TaxID=1475951 RepID=UPI001264F955|nr:PQQ-binding-like beta-propeller repeat protein [Flavicella marina]